MTKKATLADVRRTAKKFGADVEVNVNSREMLDLNVYSPPGKRWACDEIHSLVCHCTDTRYKHEHFEDVIDRMNSGLEPCERDHSNCIEWGCFDD